MGRHRLAARLALARIARLGPERPRLRGAERHALRRHAPGLMQRGWRQRRGRSRGDQRRQAEPRLGPGDGHAHAVEPGVQQRRHVAVPLAAVRRAHHHPDQPDIAPHRRGDQIAAGRIDVAGLQPIGARIGLQHAVVVRDDPAVEDEGRDGEVPILARIILDQVPRQQRQVTRGGDLVGVRPARGVAERGVRHAERAGAHRHQLRETVLVTRHQLAQRGGRIVGGLGHQTQQRLLHRDGGARQQPELGRQHARRVGGNRHQLVEADATVPQRLEQHVDRHHLGQAGGIARLVGGGGRQHLPGRGIHHQRGIPRGADLGRGVVHPSSQQQHAGETPPDSGSPPARHASAPHTPRVSLRGPREACPAYSATEARRCERVSRRRSPSPGARHGRPRCATHKRVLTPAAAEHTPALVLRCSIAVAPVGRSKRRRPDGQGRKGR